MDRNMDKPRIREINTIEQESPEVKTFKLTDPPSADATPGQFVMVWIPDSGEIPLAISMARGNEIGITVKRVGETTEVMHQLGPGSKIGVRGPYGNGFSDPELGSENLLIGGGYGISTLRFLYQKFSDQANLTVMEGAKSDSNLLFLDQLKPDIVATEDGSRGYKGFITEKLEEILQKSSYDKVYTVGPELMMHEVFQTCWSKDLKLEASLERYMKCGVGLCGSCLIDGFRVCKDGPVADLNQLAKLDEFGTLTRSPSGAKERI